MADAKVTFKVELDDSAVKQQVNQISQEISRVGNSGKGATINVKADTTAATTQLKNLEAKLGNLNGGTVQIDADTTNASSKMDTVESKAGNLSGGSVHIDADTTNATSKMSTIESKAGNLAGGTVEIDADTTNAETKIDTIESRAGNIAGSTITVDADITAAQAKFAQIAAEADALSSLNPTINVNASGGGGGTGGGGSIGGSGGGGLLSGIPVVSQVADAANWMIDGLKEGFTNAIDLQHQNAYITGGLGADIESMVPAGYNDATSYQYAMAMKHGISPIAVSDAMYQGSSAGVANKDMDTYVNSALALAAVGQSDAGSAGSMISGIGNAAGRTDYDGIADAVDKSIKYGKFSSINDIAGPVANSMASINSSLGNAGVDYRNVLAMMSTVTHTDINPALAATAMSSFNAEVTNPSTGGYANVKSALGMPFEDYMAQGNTYADAMRGIQSYADQKYGGNAGLMFDQQTSARMVPYILGADNGASFDAAYNDMVNGGNLINGGYADFQNTFSNYIARAGETGKAMFSGPIGMMANGITGFMGALNNGSAGAAYGAGVDAMMNPSQWGNMRSLADLFGGGNKETPNVEEKTQSLSQQEKMRLIATGQGDAIDPSSVKAPEGADQLSEQLTATADSLTAAAEGATAITDGTTSLGEGIDAAATATETTSASVDTLNSGLDTASTGATDAAGKMELLSVGIESLSKAVSDAVSRCNSVGAGGGGGTDGKKSVGMSYVPRDGYVATLHKGEAVLTAAQASTYRAGQAHALTANSGIDYDQLAAAMSKISFEMNGKRVGRMVETYVSEAQGQRLTRMNRR